MHSTWLYHEKGYNCRSCLSMIKQTTILWVTESAALPLALQATIRYQLLILLPFRPYRKHNCTCNIPAIGRDKKTLTQGGVVQSQLCLVVVPCGRALERDVDRIPLLHTKAERININRSAYSLKAETRWNWQHPNG